MKYFLLLLLIVGLTLPVQAQRHSRGSGRKDVHVGGYYRKNGNVCSAALPGCTRIGQSQFVPQFSIVQQSTQL